MANINSLQGKWSKIQRVAFDPCPVLVRLNLSMRGDRYGKPVLLVEKVGTTPLVLVVNLGRERDGDAGAGGEAHFLALSDSLGFGDVYPTDSLTVSPGGGQEEGAVCFLLDLEPRSAQSYITIWLLPSKGFCY